MLDLKTQLKEKDVVLELTDEAIDYLVEHGYDDKMGARPMQRLIDNKIKKDLSKELLFGSLKNGGVVKVTVKGKKLALDIGDGVKLLEKQVQHQILNRLNIHICPTSEIILPNYTPAIARLKQLWAKSLKVMDTTADPFAPLYR